MRKKPDVTIKIFDNDIKKTHQAKFMKYKSVDDYLNNYFSSDDEIEENLDQNESDDKKDEKLDLTKMAKNIKTLDDIIKLCELPTNKFKFCNRKDLCRLKKIRQPLEELNKMIGM